MKNFVKLGWRMLEVVLHYQASGPGLPRGPFGFHMIVGPLGLHRLISNHRRSRISCERAKSQHLELTRLAVILANNCRRFHSSDVCGGGGGARATRREDGRSSELSTWANVIGRDHACGHGDSNGPR